MSNERQLYQRLLDNLTTAVVLLDHQLHVRYLNPAAEMLLQTSNARMQGAHISEIYFETSEAISLLQASVGSGHPYTKREVQLQLHSQQAITVDYTVTPLVQPPQTALLLELQPRDRLLRISRDESMLAKHETVRGLVRGLAHEIKNPLGGLRGAAQLLERALPDDSLKDYTKVIIEEADRLRNLVDRLLGPHKMLKLAPLNIHTVLERVRALIDAECHGAVELVRDYDPSIPDLPGDQEQLIQAVLNITRNAMQVLTENGRRNGRILFRTRVKRQFTVGSDRHRLVCQVDIEDNGPGIPPELLDDIFYPMISGRAEGAGLGLSISQSIIHQHNGLIECESRPGKTLFTLYIPLEQPHDTRHEHTG